MQALAFLFAGLVGALMVGFVLLGIYCLGAGVASVLDEQK